MSETLKSNTAKITALFNTRRMEIKAELDRMDTVEEFCVSVLAGPESQELDMDDLMNRAVKDSNGVQWGTDAQMVLAFITKNI